VPNIKPKPRTAGLFFAIIQLTSNKPAQYTAQPPFKIRELNYLAPWIARQKTFAETTVD